MAEMPLLTGLDPEIIEAARSEGPVTLVVRSAQNVVSLIDASPGDRVFITSRSAEDLKEGLEGDVAEIESLEITLQRHTRQTGPFKEEHEMKVARVQLDCTGFGRYRSATDDLNGLPVVGEVTEVSEGFTAF